MKVYVWCGVRRECKPSANGNRQTHEIVAAPSKAAAARAAGVKYPSQLWNLGETGNARDIGEALAQPGIVLWRKLDDYQAPYNRA